jgi:hypothetical protein
MKHGNISLHYVAFFLREIHVQSEVGFEYIIKKKRL